MTGHRQALRRAQVAQGERGHGAEGREHDQGVACSGPGRDALGAQAAHETTERAAQPDARDREAQRMRIEALVHDRPEAAQDDPGHGGHVQVDEERHRARRAREQGVLGGERQGVDAEQRRQHPRRASVASDARGGEREERREGGAGHHRLGQLRGGKVRTEERIARRLGGDRQGAQRGPGQGGG